MPSAHWVIVLREAIHSLLSSRFLHDSLRRVLYIFAFLKRLLRRPGGKPGDLAGSAPDRYSDDSTHAVLWKGSLQSRVNSTSSDQTTTSFSRTPGSLPRFNPELGGSGYLSPTSGSRPASASFPVSANASRESVRLSISVQTPSDSEHNSMSDKGSYAISEGPVPENAPDYSHLAANTRPSSRGSSISSRSGRASHRRRDPRLAQGVITARSASPSRVRGRSPAPKRESHRSGTSTPNEKLPASARASKLSVVAPPDGSIAPPVSRSSSNHLHPVNEILQTERYERKGSLYAIFSALCVHCFVLTKC